jgi:hypothetical protein
MSRTKWLLAIVVSFAAVGAVSAQDEAPKWTYIEAGFIDFDPDGGVSDDGFFAGASIGLGKMFHIVAEYDSVGDYGLWEAGVGWHGLFGDPVDLFVEVKWKDIDFDSDTNDFSDDGYAGSAGIRWMLGQRFEVKGTATWVNFDEGDSDATFEAEALFFLMENRLGLGASFDIGDANTLRVFARWNFGK